MANVKFLRGLQANLPVDGNAVDGVFYLTTDTNRLYIGDSSNNKKLLNQTVQIVPDLETLVGLSTQWRTNNTATDHINDFYYIGGDKNILAVFTNTGSDAGWQQINPDTNTHILSSSLTASSSATDNVSLALGLTDNDNTQNLGSSIGIVADGTAHVGVENGNIKITGDTYSLSEPNITSVAAAHEATATINLVNSGDATQNSSLQIKSKNTETLEISKTGNVLELNVPEQDDTSLLGGSVTLDVDNGTLEVKVKDSNNNEPVGSIDRIGIALSDGTYSPLIQAQASDAVGSIYSKNEIDTLLGGLNGMTYKGTIGSTGTVAALPSTGVQNGDTYVIVDSNFDFGSATVVGGDPSLGVNVGDMIIAKGTETLTTVNNEPGYYITSGLTWTYVPAGNDSLEAVTYHPVLTANTHTTSLQNGNNQTLVQHSLVAGTNISLSSAVSSSNGGTNNALTTTVNHETITTSTPAATSVANGTATFVAVTGLTVSNGHVTEITTDTFTPVTYELGKQTTLQTAFGPSNPFASNGSSNSANVNISLSDSNGPVNSVDVNVASSSLITRATSTGISIDLEWGSF